MLYYVYNCSWVSGTPTTAPMGSFLYVGGKDV